MTKNYKNRMLINMKDLLLYFLDEIGSLDESQHGERFIEYLISPVITGIKPASTINLKNSKRNLYNYWNKNGHKILDRHKLESMILKEFKDRIILLIYDKNNLYQHLNLENNYKFLSQFDYKDINQLESCLEGLKDRVNMTEFPHESGIFLGIPREDVIGFINGDEYIYSRYWKVYTDKYNYNEIFDLYDKSRKICMFNTLENKEDNIKDLYAENRKSLYKGKE